MIDLEPYEAVHALIKKVLETKILEPVEVSPKMAQAMLEMIIHQTGTIKYQDGLLESYRNGASRQTPNESLQTNKA